MTILLIASIAQPASAYAATSIRYGWAALDSSKKPVLQGSQYPLSGAVKPVAYITNGKVTVPVNNKSVVYLDNTKLGTGQALIMGKNIVGYKDAFMTTFTIIKEQPDISKMSISGIGNKTYTGGAIKPGVTVKNNSRTLKNGTDYTLTYLNSAGKQVTPTNAGSYKVVIKGKGNYKGSKTIGFNITKANIANAAIDPIRDRYADGFTAVTPTTNVKLNGRHLTAGVDYTLSYIDAAGKGTTPKAPGAYRAVIKAKGGNYTGSKNVAFNLVNIGDDLARYACRMSYSRRVTYKSASSSAYTGTDAYKKSGARRGCHSAMYGAYKGSGYWKAFKANNYDAESAYKKSKSRWRYLGKFVPGKRTTSKGIQLLPGDTLCGCRGGGYHTCMYVGKQIPIEIYYNYIKPTTDALKKKKGVSKFQAKKRGGDVGKPYSNIDFVSASYHTIFAGCYCSAESSYANYYGKNMKVYRLIQPDIKKYRAGNVVQ